MSTVSESALAGKIGLKMKDIRKEKKITLIELSQSTGVAQATLSRMENGQMLGTVESHRRIAEALGVSLSRFYEGIDSRSESVKIQKETDKRKVVFKNDHAKCELLISEITSKKIVPALISLQAHGKTQMDRAERGTDKFLWVLDGTIQVKFENSHYDLESHDSIYFDASAPHQIVNTSSRQAKILAVTSNY